jgi:hypothetical protein
MKSQEFCDEPDHPPAVALGRVVIGAQDGRLYVLG